MEKEKVNVKGKAEILSRSLSLGLVKADCLESGVWKPRFKIVGQITDFVPNWNQFFTYSLPSCQTPGIIP